MKKKFTILLAVLMIISTLPITVVPASAASGNNIMVSVPWDKINNCGHQQYSGPCQAYCWAYCRIILDNTPHTYRDYWTGSQAVAPSAAGYVSQSLKMKSKQILLETICNNIDLGRPVVVGVNGTPGNAHFVVAIGYRAACNRSNLSESDILILDPASNRIDAANGTNETYSYLSSRTLTYITASNNYVCWITTSGGVGTTTGSDPTPPNNPPQYFDCDVWIACIYGQVVNLYNNPGDSRRSDYFSLGQSVPSTYGAKLSDGSTWYRITANSLGVDRTFWLKAENGKMTITDLSQPTVCSHNWNAGVVTKEPTLTSTGVRRYTCTLCGATRDEDIPAKDTISGRWSDTAGWTFSASPGTLPVSGTGEFGLTGLGASKEIEPLVKRILVGEGITSLRLGALSELSNVVSVELPQSLTRIESTAFCRCTSLKEITLPSNVSDVRANAFQEMHRIAKHLC